MAKQKSRRNKNAGKSTGKSKSAKYFAKNPKARAKKNAYKIFSAGIIVGLTNLACGVCVGQIISNMPKSPCQVSQKQRKRITTSQIDTNNDSKNDPKTGRILGGESARILGGKSGRILGRILGGGSR